jgi:hypothetical protein
LQISDFESTSERVNKNLRFKIKINVFSVEAHKWECWASDARQNDGWQNHFFDGAGALPRDC